MLYFTIVLVNTIRIPFHLISPEHVSQMRGLYKVWFCAWVLLHAWKGPYLEYGIYAVYWYLDSRYIRHMSCSGARQHQVRKVVDCCSTRRGLSWTDSQGCSLYIPWPHIYHIYRYLAVRLSCCHTSGCKTDLIWPGPDGRSSFIDFWWLIPKSHDVVDVFSW